MISIVTTAVNRPKVAHQMIQSLFDNSNVLSMDCEWLVNVDRVKNIERSAEDFYLTVDTFRAISAWIPVLVLPQWNGGGQGNGLNRLRPRVRGDVVFYLEDDWLCRPEDTTGEKLDLRKISQRLEKYAFTTLRGRKGKPSMQPNMMRRENFLGATEGIRPDVDCEHQYMHNWAAAFAKDPEGWAIHPAHDTYFEDLGLDWRAEHSLHKWKRMQHYHSPVTYCSDDEDTSREDLAPMEPQKAFAKH